MKIGELTQCTCCHEEFVMPCKEKEYKWKLDHEMFCSYKCYSKTFDGKYKEAKLQKQVNIGWKRNR